MSRVGVCGKQYKYFIITSIVMEYVDDGDLYQKILL